MWLDDSNNPNRSCFVANGNYRVVGVAIVVLIANGNKAYSRVPMIACRPTVSTDTILISLCERILELILRAFPERLR